MSATLTTNFKEEFERAAKLLWGTETKKGLVAFTNEIALKVVYGAEDNTRVANPDEIRTKMGVTSVNLTTNKAGQLKLNKKGRVYVSRNNRFNLHPISLAKKIILAQDAKGNHLFPGGTPEQRAQKLINAKVRSNAYIKEGWVPVISTLLNVVRGRGTWGNIFGTRKDLKRGRVHAGGARPATLLGSDMFVATVENKLLAGKTSYWFGKKTDPTPVGAAGLEKGFRAATVDMMDHLRRRLEKRFAQKH